METIIKSHSKTVTIGPDHPLVIIGERINPTGRKRLANALEVGDLTRVQEEAVLQVKEGAHVLDVNVGVSGIDEPQILKTGNKLAFAVELERMDATGFLDKGGVSRRSQEVAVPTVKLFW